MDIRRAKETDVPDLLTMVERYRAFEGLSGFDRERVGTQLRRLLADDRLGCGWIVRVDGLPAAYLLAVYVFSLEHLGLTAEIDEFYVESHHRAQGLGAELLRRAEEEFIAACCTNVSLQIARANVEARAFYEARGYAARERYEILDKKLRGGMVTDL